MEYKIVDYPETNTPGQTLKKIIEKGEQAGYRYVNHQYVDKLAGGSSGCFGLGASPPVPTHIGFVVFVKEV